MKKVIFTISILMVFLISACSSTRSLQEYFVDNTENPNFISLDVPASILNIEEANLTNDQRVALGSLKKMNILAFKKTTTNVADYKMEKANVKEILANDDFNELIKMNTDFGRAVVKYKGDDDAIDEVIIFGDNKDKGFALVRVLGKDMNPAHFMQLIQAIQATNFNADGLNIGALFKD
ncbi:DUF4252 domain-containing protein [Maribacter sp. CXY002]|uniref:DUF4252 domain-containing protein n=1 Tax=Maribacter luteocoastalis TaxID=3407671 RepID=UPI003B6854A3